MAIDRREFIGMAVTAAASCLVPELVTPRELKTIIPPKRYVGEEYGNMVPVRPGATLTMDVVNRVVREVLLRDAWRTVGKNVPVEIRVKFTKPGQLGGIAWYTNERIMRKRPQVVTVPKICLDGGYIYCGRVVTPAYQCFVA